MKLKKIVRKTVEEVTTETLKMPHELDSDHGCNFVKSCTHIDCKDCIFDNPEKFKLLAEFVNNPSYSVETNVEE